MQNHLKAKMAKALVGTVAAGAMAVSSAAPAFARDRDGGIGAGEIIAGALVIGGIAAIAASAGKDNDRDYRYDRAGYRYDGRYDSRSNYRYGQRDNPRTAVEQCVRAAENRASRHSWGGRANVTDIQRVDRKYFGYEITGRIAVNSTGRDNRGWNNSRRGADMGSFYCRVSEGRIAALGFDGIRGL